MKKKNLIIGIFLGVFALFFILQSISGGLLGEFLFDRPNKPKIKHAEFPFELVYEYNGEDFIISESIVCDYKDISFALEGGNYRDWDCYITNNARYGQYYLDEVDYPSLYIQVPLNAEYYMGAPDAKEEFALPYIFYIDESTGTTYYEQDLIDAVGARIISWSVSEPLKDNIK